jgi:hypothetical protein
MNTLNDMSKTAFVFIIVIFFSCKQRVAEKPQLNLRDSIVAKHLSLIDSLDFYDTANYDLRILKAYIKNDTPFFKKMNKDMDIAQENRDSIPSKLAIS